MQLCTFVHLQSCNLLILHKAPQFAFMNNDVSIASAAKCPNAADVDESPELIYALWELSSRYSERASKLLKRSNESAVEVEKKTLLKGYAELVTSALKCLVEALEAIQKCPLIDDKAKLCYEFASYERLFFTKFEFSLDFNGMEECLVKAVCMLLIFDF